MQYLENDNLQKLYKEAEFDREHEEVKEIEERITSLVHEISEDIGRKDPLFKNSVIPSGSHFEDLKVEGPDEFDFMVCLKTLSSPGVCVTKDIPQRPVADPGYVHVEVADEEVRQRWQHYISTQGNLRPDLLLNKFKDLVKEALEKRKRRSGEKITERVEIELRKIPVTIKVRWNGRVYTDYEIAIDLTLCIKQSGWPTASDIRGRLKRGHPGYEVFEKAVRLGSRASLGLVGDCRFQLQRVLF